MEQYLQALRDREDVSEEVLLELEERFKVVEEVIEIPIVPTETERIEALEMLEEKIEEHEGKIVTIEEALNTIFGGV